MIDTESSMSDLSELTCWDSSPYTNVERAIERISDACAYRKLTVSEKPPQLGPTDRRFAFDDECRKVTASELRDNQNSVVLVIKDIELPKCEESRELIREEALRVKILESSGIFECAACNGGGHVYENLSKFVETGGVKVKCSACKGSGEYSGSEYEKQGFGTVPTPHDDGVDALTYALPMGLILNPIDKT